MNLRKRSLREKVILYFHKIQFPYIFVVATLTVVICFAIGSSIEPSDSITDSEVGKILVWSLGIGAVVGLILLFSQRYSLRKVIRVSNNNFKLVKVAFGDIIDMGLKLVQEEYCFIHELSVTDHNGLSLERYLGQKAPLAEITLCDDRLDLGKGRGIVQYSALVIYEGEITESIDYQNALEVFSLNDDEEFSLSKYFQKQLDKNHEDKKTEIETCFQSFFDKALSFTPLYSALMSLFTVPGNGFTSIKNISVKIIDLKFQPVP